MKGLYDVARHLVWLTQFGLSVVIPPTLCIAGSVWLLDRQGRPAKKDGKKAPPPISFNRH